VWQPGVGRASRVSDRADTVDGATAD
jgi:hypothetical protein